MNMWNERFDSSPDKALLGFTESISYDKELYKYDIEGSKAHAAMLSESGIIPKASSDSIIAALDNVKEKIDKGDFTFRTELEDIHMNIESAITEAIGEEGARLHTARSRNDQIALDIRLYIRDRISGISKGIRSMQKALLEQSKMNVDAVMPGYTHMQRAQPVLFSHHLLAYIEMFDRDCERLADCMKRVNVMPLGSGALAGTTLPINREAVAKKLGFEQLTRNSMDAVSDRDFLCEFLSALSIFAMHVSRLSEDIVLWMTSEFSFLELPDAFCTGSSLMPQKKNPDIAELSRGKTGRVYGDLIALLTIMKGLPMTYNRDLQEDKEPVFDAVKTVEKILSVYPAMISSMKVRKDNMRKSASDPMLMATDMAEKLVEAGMPFRTAHKRIGALVKMCSENNIPLNKVSLDEMKKIIPEANSEFLHIFSPDTSIYKRKSYGATGSLEVGRQIGFWTEKLG